MIDNENRIKPQSSPNKIYIELNENSYTFDKKAFVPAYLNGLIQIEEWDQLLYEAGRIMAQSWTKKKTCDEIKMPRHFILIFLISLIFCIIYMICLYIAGTTSGDNTGLTVVALVAISLATAATFIIATYNFTRQMVKFRVLEDIMQEDIDNYLNTVNNKYRGVLNFVYMPSTKWIECNILDSRNYNAVAGKDKLNLSKNNKDVENGGKWSEAHSRIASG